MEIIQELLIQCNSGDKEIRSQAEQTILQIREEDKNNFLQMLSFFLANNDHSSKTNDTLALILAHRTITFSINKNSDFNEFDADLINNLLHTSSTFFSSDNFSLRSSAATLFSKILLNDQISENKFESIQYLINLFQDPKSPLIIHPLSIIIDDYCYYYLIDSSIILSILESLSFFFKFENSEVNCYCLEIISILIPSMGEIIATEIEKLFPLLLQYSQNPSTMPKSFECLALIGKHFYPLLDDFLPIITSNDFIELILISESVEEKDNIFNSYLSFWKSISQNEINCENDVHNLKIIENTFLQLIPIILKIASSSQSTIIDSDSNEPSTLANKVLNIILSQYINQSLPILESFVNDSQSSESFGERETTLSCVCFMIQYLKEEDIDEYFRLIKNGFLDEVPRVRQNAIYCGEYFCEKYQTSNPQSIEIMQIIISRITEDEFTAEDAAIVIGHLFSIKDFPYFEESMISLLELSSSSELKNSKAAFKSLKKLVKYADLENRQKFLDLLLQLFENCTSYDEYHFEKLITLLTELICRLKGKIDEKFDIIWELLTSGVSKFPFLFVLPISQMSSSCKTKFLPYLETTLNLINDILNSEHFELGCASLKIIIQKSYLTEFAPLFTNILESMIKLLQNEEIPAPNKRMAVEVFDKINQKIQKMKEIPPNFDSIIYNVLPIISKISFELNDWEDFDSNSDYLRFFSGVLEIKEEEEDQQENRLMACKSIFYILSLVVDHPIMDDYYLDSIIDSLYLISKIFPDLLNQFYQEHRALEMTLKYILSVVSDFESQGYESQIDKIKISAIFDVLKF